MKYSNLKTKCIILMLILLHISPKLVLAQNDSKDIVIGKYRTLDSKFLGEERKLLISLPEDYQLTNQNYPVLYLLYGNQIRNYFIEAIYSINNLSIETPIQHGGHITTPLFCLGQNGN